MSDLVERMKGFANRLMTSSDWADSNPIRLPTEVAVAGGAPFPEIKAATEGIYMGVLFWTSLTVTCALQL